jgi:hypothetical protein
LDPGFETAIAIVIAIKNTTVNRDPILIAEPDPGSSGKPSQGCFPQSSFLKTKP